MGMFLNYQSIANNYQPNNLIKAFPTKFKDSKLDPVNESRPFELYNAKGELEGYYWRYGETLNLEFNIDGEITIEGNAIIMSGKGQSPTTETVGKVGQRLYNISDIRSYTCVAVTYGKYIWREDEEFTYPTSATRSVYIQADDYLKDKTVEVTIYNFRMEPICTKTFVGASTVRFVIDKELSEKLVRGIYYCSAKVFNDIVSNVVFEPTDCRLLVK